MLTRRRRDVLECIRPRKTGRAVAHVGLCLIAAIMGLTHTPAVARDFRAADIQAHDYPTVQAIEFMARLITERSGNRHKVTLFHSRQLGEEMETIEQTRIGAIDINRVNIAPLATIAPNLHILGLPFLFRTEEHLHKVLDGPIGEAVLSGLESYGLVGLTFYDSGARSVYNRLRPIQSLSDMRGMRIRIQQSDVAERMIRAMGAEPIVLAYGQVPTALTTQLIDGAENNWPSYVTTDHFKVARFHTATDHSMAPEVLVISKKAWDGLDPSDRELFKNAARESAVFMRAQWRTWELRSKERAIAAGNIMISDFDRSAFEDAVKPMYDEAYREPSLRDAIDRIRQVR